MDVDKSGPRMVFSEPVDMTGAAKAKRPKTGDVVVPVALQLCFLDPGSINVPHLATTRNRPIKSKPDQPAIYIPPAPPPRMVIKRFDPNATTTAASSIFTDTPSDAIALSKTIYYRHLKKGGVSKGKRTYNCKKCNTPMELPHRQYNGKRYCPEVDEMPYEEWLVEMKDYFKKKKEGNPKPWFHMLVFLTVNIYKLKQTHFAFMYITINRKKQNKARVVQ